jgi:hypothetical protein
VKLEKADCLAVSMVGGGCYSAGVLRRLDHLVIASNFSFKLMLSSFFTGGIKKE